MGKFYSIEFNVNEVSKSAVSMLEIAASQGHWSGYHPDSDGNVEIDVIDYDSLGSDDTLSVRIKSTLSYRERAKRFGIAGLEQRSAEKDEGGNPKWGKTDDGLTTNHLIPTDEHLDGVEKFYDDGTLDREIRWSLRDASELVFGKVKGDQLTGAEAMNAIAREYERFCREGHWSPVIPRGRKGGRKTIADEPTVPKRISITQSDWEYLQSLGERGASGAIRKLVAQDRGS